MKYGKVVSGEFISRPNRFIAHAAINGVEHRVHVKNTGRCRELLIPGCKVWLAAAENTERKTGYDLVAVEKSISGAPPLLINMDSQAPNTAAEEFFRQSGIFSPAAVIRREVRYRNSRFDFYIEDHGRKVFCEVKGVTLEEGGRAFFPDAPTLRGVKHIQELTEAAAEGFEAWILFAVQMQGISSFAPNDAMHPQFGDALREAAAAGVGIMARGCRISPDSIEISEKDVIPVLL